MSDDAPRTTRTRYLYQAVAGASVWGKPAKFPTVRQAVCALRLRYPDAEVERVLELPGNARRYWRWRGGRWSLRFYDDPSPADLARWDFAPSIAEVARG